MAAATAEKAQNTKQSSILQGNNPYLLELNKNNILLKNKSSSINNSLAKNPQSMSASILNGMNNMQNNTLYQLAQ